MEEEYMYINGENYTYWIRLRKPNFIQRFFWRFFLGWQTGANENG